MLHYVVGIKKRVSHEGVETLSKGGETNMTTVINTPAAATESGGGMGMIIGLFVLMGFAFLFFVYGMPMLRSSNRPTTIQTIVPKAEVPAIVVPDKINVTVEQK